MDEPVHILQDGCSMMSNSLRRTCLFSCDSHEQRAYYKKETKVCAGMAVHAETPDVCCMFSQGMVLVHREFHYQMEIITLFLREIYDISQVAQYFELSNTIAYVRCAYTLTNIFKLIGDMTSGRLLVESTLIPWAYIFKRFSRVCVDRAKQ